MTQSNLDRAAIAIAQRVESAINRAANPTPVPDTIKTEVVKALEEAGFEQKMGNLQTILLAMQATLEQIKADKGTGGATRPVTPAPAAPPAQPEPPQPTEPPAPVKPLVRSLNFFGDSTNARLGDQAINLAKADNLPVINNAAGGSLASYALMSMNGSPVEIKFSVDTIPAKDRNVFIDAELVYGEGVTPFSLHSTIVIIGDNIEASVVGQTANVKVYPRDEQAHSIVVGQQYPVKLKNNGGTDGICVLATGKNDVNGANWSNWQAALERVKGYIQKCIALVQPKDTPRYIILPIWADNKPGWSKEEHPYRHQLKDELNKWIRTTYGANVYDIEAYMLSEQIWTDTGITPNEADKQAQKDGIMPLSLSYDGGAHFLPAVETIIAGKIIAKAKELKYL
ncbi:hypothetical protein [Neisseria mucosa]|uniref:hypothetical protein n=1 Tax=Neisseria mucosa TaxID=488 RepID=UPI0019236B22|nr:hypothetical protein [Neisseria mucosa]